MAQAIAAAVELFGRVAKEALDSLGLGRYVAGIMLDADAVQEFVAETLSERDGEVLADEVGAFLASQGGK